MLSRPAQRFLSRVEARDPVRLRPMATKPKGSGQDPELEKIAAVARAGVGRAPLYRWLWKRHDDFAALMDECRPNWRKLSEGFAELGIRAPDGQPINPETVRATWYRVRRDMAAGREKRAAKAVPAPAPPVTPAAPASPAKAVVPGDPLAEFRRQMNERSGRKG